MVHHPSPGARTLLLRDASHRDHRMWRSRSMCTRVQVRGISSASYGESWTSIVLALGPTWVRKSIEGTIEMCCTGPVDLVDDSHRMLPASNVPPVISTASYFHPRPKFPHGHLNSLVISTAQQSPLPVAPQSGPRTQSSAPCPVVAHSLFLVLLSTAAARQHCFSPRAAWKSKPC